MTGDAVPTGTCGPPRLTWREAAGVLLAVLAFSLALGLAMHDACVNPGPPVEHPEAGTPRAAYCSVANRGNHRGLPAAPATSLVGIGMIATGRRKAWASE